MVGFTDDTFTNSDNDGGQKEEKRRGRGKRGGGRGGEGCILPFLFRPLREKAEA